jgi:hypothetical protein
VHGHTHLDHHSTSIESEQQSMCAMQEGTAGWAAAEGAWCFTGLVVCYSSTMAAPNACHTMRHPNMQPGLL